MSSRPGATGGSGREPGAPPGTVLPPGPDHARLTLDPTPDPDPDRWLRLICASRVWAARAFDFHDPDRPRRNDLRRAARALRVPESLVATSAARLRSKKPPDPPRRRPTSAGPV